jgi:hypothetical protein
MARMQLIRGTGAELLPYLEQHRERKDLMLIIPEEEPPEQCAEAGRDDAAGTQSRTEYRNGVPLLPTQKAAQSVTMALVKRLAEEE